MGSSTAAGPNSTGRAVVPFLLLGTAAIIFGGLFSAATARETTYHSAWFVAYLVLVVGVAQVALGVGQWWLTPRPLSVAFIAGQLVLFIVGNAGVIVGTLLAAALWVDVGSILLVVAVASFGWAVRGSKRRARVRWVYGALLVFLLVSVVVGLYFAHVGAP